MTKIPAKWAIFILYAIILFISYFFLTPLFAYEAGTMEEMDELDKWRPLVGSKKLELGYEVSNIVYKEPGVMREEGVMRGISGAFTYYGWLPPLLEEDKNGMLKIEGKFSEGEVDYKNSGTIDNIRDYMIEVRALFGSVFYQWEIAAIPYI